MFTTLKGILLLPASFSPTAPSADGVQVGRSRWELTNELDDAGCDAHYQHFASGEAKNRNFRSKWVKLHWSYVPLSYHSVRFLLSFVLLKMTHTHCFKVSALIIPTRLPYIALYRFINSTFLLNTWTLNLLYSFFKFIPHLNHSRVLVP